MKFAKYFFLTFSSLIRTCSGFQPCFKVITHTFCEWIICIPGSWLCNEGQVCGQVTVGARTTASQEKNGEDLK